MKEPNEIRVLKEFILEFNPLYQKNVLDDLKYHELVAIARITITEMES